MRFSLAWVKQFLGIGSLVGTKCQSVWPSCDTIILSPYAAPVPLCKECFNGGWKHKACDHLGPNGWVCRYEEIVAKWPSEIALWVDSLSAVRASDGTWKPSHVSLIEESIAERDAAVMALQVKVGQAVERQQKEPIPELLAGVREHLLAAGSLKRALRVYEDELARTKPGANKVTVIGSGEGKK